jgi:hypothetical protein
MYAASNLITFAAFFGSFCGWGRLVCGPGARAGLRPAAGISCCAIVASLGFDCGLTVAATGRIIFGVAAGGCLLWWLGRREDPRPRVFLAAAIALAAALLLVAPIVVGGPQFGLFQGNINDQFNYLASAVVRTTESHQAIVAASPADFLKNPLLAIAHTMAGARPAVVDLYACLEAILPGNLHRCSYGFMAALLMASFFSVSELVRQLCGAQPWRANLVAAAYVTGFWGQLQIDLNAWSWVAATPLAAAALAAMVGAPPLSPDPARARSGWQVGLVIGILAAGLVYVYPEMFVFLSPAVLAALALAVLSTGGKRHFPPIYAVSAAVALALTAPVLGSAARFAFHQVSFSSRANFSALDWMWQSIVGGPASGAGSLELALRWTAGSLGLSWLLAAAATRWIAVAGALAAVGCAGYFVRRIAPSRLPALFAAAVAGLVAAEVVACVALGFPWVASKGISYLSVLALPLVLMPASTGRIEAWRVPAWALLCFQVALGLLRPFAAGDPDGIHYRIASYPAVMDPVLKTERSWDVGEGPESLGGSRRVKIDVPDLWLETYAAICTQAQGIPYSKGLPVYIYLGISDASYGRQAPSGEFDGLVYMDYDRNQRHTGLGFARQDGAVHTAGAGPRIVRIQSARPLDTLNGLLAWPMRLGGGESVARISVRGVGAGDSALELGLLAPESARGALRLSVETAGGTRAIVAVAGDGPRVVQGIRVPVRLAPGGDDISLALQATGAGVPDSLVVTLVNPHILAGR